MHDFASSPHLFTQPGFLHLVAQVVKPLPQSCTQSCDDVSALFSLDETAALGAGFGGSVVGGLSNGVLGSGHATLGPLLSAGRVRGSASAVSRNEGPAGRVSPARSARSRESAYSTRSRV